MDVKDIGIKNNFHIYQILVNAAFVIFIILSVVFWVFCYSDYNDNQLLKNGIEVQAEIVDVKGNRRIARRFPLNDKGVGMHIFIYCTGRKRIFGVGGQFTQKQYAVEHIGETVTIIIDPTNGYSTRGTLKSIAFYQKEQFYPFCTCLCIYGIALCIFLFVFYRVVYRNKLNQNILDSLQSGFINISITQGEVTKVIKWMVCYVKVKYKDERGVTREKWARAWFSHKEVKYLEKKRIINIVPYKNTYGILEVMPEK